MRDDIMSPWVRARVASKRVARQTLDNTLGDRVPADRRVEARGYHTEDEWEQLAQAQEQPREEFERELDDTRRAYLRTRQA